MIVISDNSQGDVQVEMSDQGTEWVLDLFSPAMARRLAIRILEAAERAELIRNDEKL